MTDLRTLANRLATEPPTRELWREAFDAVWPRPILAAESSIWGERFDRFEDLIFLGAWLSAAEMLMPEGARIMVFTHDDGSWRCLVRGHEFAVDAPTETQARASAAVRAMAVEREQR